MSELRERARAFAESHGADSETVSAITLAISEAVTNAVMHAFVDREPGLITLTCAAGPGELRFAVADDGRGMLFRTDSPGMGAGLSTMGQLATRMDVRPAAVGGGTIVELAFDAAGVRGQTAVARGDDEGRLLLAASALARSAAWPVEGVERLCDLALDGFADAACVDVVEHGCLRRLGAGVHADERLSAQLRDSTPPLKPGTATWAALHGGGPQLVVHDPSVPRSPGGVGALPTSRGGCRFRWPMRTARSSASGGSAVAPDALCPRRRPSRWSPRPARARPGGSRTPGCSPGCRPPVAGWRACSTPSARR